MNKDNAEEYLPLVQALADGKTIQYNEGSNSDWWADIENPEFYDDVEYRIKPEPIERWLAVWDDNPRVEGQFSKNAYESKEACERAFKGQIGTFKAIKLVEAE